MVDEVKFEDKGLVTAVVQDCQTNELLMVAYMNKEALERTLKEFEADPQMTAYSMAKARILCPLLDEKNECILYPHRPITCRVYGIPTMIQGMPRVCGKAGFKKDQSYPAFNIDGVHRELHDLSKEVLKGAGTNDPERASLLISVSKVIRTPVEDLLKEDLSGPDTKG